MTTRFTTLKKLTGAAVMATAATAVGLGLGSGTAQASPIHLNPHPHIMTPFNHRVGHLNQRVITSSMASSLSLASARGPDLITGSTRSSA